VKANGYYGREGIMHLDGTRIFQNEVDQQNEQGIARNISIIWQCRLCPFGALSPIDWYAERHGRLVGVLELKARSHQFSKYPSVFLNVRKWLALSLASVGLGCPAIFVVRFTDGAFWCSVSEIDASVTRIGGCTQVVKSVNDIEPLIEVKTEIMKPLSLFRDT
jgi:hypothetical protein